MLLVEKSSILNKSPRTKVVSRVEAILLLTSMGECTWAYTIFSATVASGPEAALASYTDVCTRTITINEMIQNPRMLVMLGLSNVDFGAAIQGKSAAVKEAIKSAN